MKNFVSKHRHFVGSFAQDDVTENCHDAEKQSKKYNMLQADKRPWKKVFNKLETYVLEYYQ